jgi:hypothetical protein
MERRVHKCPVCNEREFEIERIRCTNCDTRIEGIFTLSKFALLPEEHLEFLGTFIKCRGNIKDVERELGISYPTVRSRLDRAIEALGYQDSPGKIQRKEVLESLERGEMTAEDALNALKAMQE